MSSSTANENDNLEESNQTNDDNNNSNNNNRIGKRQSVINLAKSIVVNGPISTAAAAVSRPQAIGAILRDAAGGAVELSINNSSDDYSSRTSLPELKESTAKAFSVAEQAIEDVQEQLNEIRQALQQAKLEAYAAIEDVEVEIKEVKTEKEQRLQTPQVKNPEVEMYEDLEGLGYDDVDYELSEMAPPFIGEDMCLVPGVPLVRVERAPENSRRIFAGIDIMASVNDVWNLLTDYENLHKVIPNLANNTVLDLYPGDPDTHTSDFQESPNIPSEIQCQSLANKLKGAKLKQVGKAKVVGINFSARSTVEVREWPEGMPDFAHFDEDVYGGESREQRIRESKTIPLTRYRFPRPFSISKLPSKAISMQSVVDDDGEFRIYQGVWRMQPLPGCSAPGTTSAMRLTYAVEISPRAYLPVRIIEGRIAQELCANLEAIRDFVTATEEEELTSV